MFKAKGNRGYITSKKIKYLLMALGLAIVILAFVCIGYFLTGNTKNIYTIMGVLTALPFANIITVYIALFPFSKPDEEEYKKIALLAENTVFSTELVITSTNLKSLMLDYCVVMDRLVVAYSRADTKNLKEYENYISGMLASHSLQFDVKIFSDYNSFYKFLKKSELIKKKDASDMVLGVMDIIESISM